MDCKGTFFTLTIQKQAVIQNKKPLYILTY